MRVLCEGLKRIFFAHIKQAYALSDSFTSEKPKYNSVLSKDAVHDTSAMTAILILQKVTFVQKEANEVTATEHKTSSLFVRWTEIMSREGFWFVWFFDK